MDHTLKDIRRRRTYAPLHADYVRIRTRDEAQEAIAALFESLDILGHRVDFDHEAEGLIASALRNTKAIQRYLNRPRKPKGSK